MQEARVTVCAGSDPKLGIGAGGEKVDLGTDASSANPPATNFVEISDESSATRSSTSSKSKSTSRLEYQLKKVGRYAMRRVRTTVKACNTKKDKDC